MPCNCARRGGLSAALGGAGIRPSQAQFHAITQFLLGRVQDGQRGLCPLLESRHTGERDPEIDPVGKSVMRLLQYLTSGTELPLSHADFGPDLGQLGGIGQGTARIVEGLVDVLPAALRGRQAEILGDEQLRHAHMEIRLDIEEPAVDVDGLGELPRFRQRPGVAFARGVKSGSPSTARRYALRLRSLSLSCS